LFGSGKSIEEEKNFATRSPVEPKVAEKKSSGKALLEKKRPTPSKGGSKNAKLRNKMDERGTPRNGRVISCLGLPYRIQLSKSKGMARWLVGYLFTAGTTDRATPLFQQDEKTKFVGSRKEQRKRSPVAKKRKGVSLPLSGAQKRGKNVCANDLTEKRLTVEGKRPTRENDDVNLKRRRKKLSQEKKENVPSLRETAVSMLAREKRSLKSLESREWENEENRRLQLGKR